MGCGTSKSSDAVNPAKSKNKKCNSMKKATNGNRRKENKDPKEVIISRKEAEQADLPGAVPDNESELMPPPISFEISANEESIIKKHPPKRFQKLEDINMVTNKQIHEKQMSARERRSQHLQERVQSSRQTSRRHMSRSAMPASKLEPTIPE